MNIDLKGAFFFTQASCADDSQKPVARQHRQHLQRALVRLFPQSAPTTPNGACGRHQGHRSGVCEERIRLNAVSPGLVNTQIWKTSSTPSIRKRNAGFWKANIPIERVIEPEENRRAVVFLLSDESACHHWRDIFADGGLTSQFASKPSSSSSRCWERRVERTVFRANVGDPLDYRSVSRSENERGSNVRDLALPTALARQPEGRKALQASRHVPRGEIFGLLGRMAAANHSLSHSLHIARGPQAEPQRYSARRGNAPTEVRKRIGVVSNRRVSTRVTVLENLRHQGPPLRACTGRLWFERSKEMLGRVGMTIARTKWSSTFGRHATPGRVARDSASARVVVARRTEHRTRSGRARSLGIPAHMREKEGVTILATNISWKS